MAPTDALDRMDARGRVTVRQMTPADMDPLRWVIYRAYYQVLLDLYGADSASQYEVRSLDFMALYLRRDAAGSFVAQTEDGGIAGGLFCFVWGEVGWFGSLAVAPEFQGRAAGQALTQHAIDYLRQRGCRRIGLETWPKAPLTRHLYTKLGFELCRPTIKLSREVSTPHVPASDAWSVSWTSSGDAAALNTTLDAVSDLTEDIRAAVPPSEARVHYRHEVRVPVAGGFAEAAVLRDTQGVPQALALAYTRKPSGGPTAALDIRLLLVSPSGGEPALAAILAACDRRAFQLGAHSVTCDVNLRHTRAAALLRERGFRPTYGLVRMELPAPGIDLTARTQAIECARWAG